MKSKKMMLLVGLITLFLQLGLSSEHTINNRLILNSGFRLPEIYFEYKETTLSKPMIDSLHLIVVRMKRKPEIRLVIDAHASQNEGNNKEKVLISEKRGRSCLEYFTIMGIDSTRFQIKIWGDSLPQKGCDRISIENMPQESRETAYAANRRVGFRIITITKLSSK
jgi:outer membrane protein OmpA-like peptidoglycan-associated protein